MKLVTKKFRVENYKTPSQKSIEFVDPEFAIKSNTAKNKNAVSEVCVVSNFKKEITCFNCKKQGHINKNCPEPRNIHCYKCGANGFTSKTCKNCNSSNSNPENALARN